jgi:hypothetical protein
MAAAAAGEGAGGGAVSAVRVSGVVIMEVVGMDIGIRLAGFGGHLCHQL